MNTLTQAPATAPAIDRSMNGWRPLFYFTVFWGALIPWLAPHPPMIDLPQHAAQLMLLKAMAVGGSPWLDLFRLNPYTPYFIGFGLALPLAFVMTAAAALKTLLTVAYLCFVFASVQLRRQFGADSRMDWMAVPVFFGFTYLWGFFTFLVAAPVALWFILLADRHAGDTTARRSAGLVALGLVLMLSHGLCFLFACGIGGALATVNARSLRGWMRALIPYVVLGVVLVAYSAVRSRAEAQFGMPPTVPAINWHVGLRHEILVYPFGAQWHPLLVFACAALLAAPFALGLRLAPLRDLRRWVPAAMLFLVLGFVPHFAFETAFLYQRFGLFLFPIYALLFVAHTGAEGTWGPRRIAGLALLVLACWAVLGLQSVRTVRFAEEAAAFEEVTARIEPGQRALALIFDSKSQAFDGAGLYVHYASWYQAERSGHVDFNFAWLPQLIVRFKPEQLTPVAPTFARRPESFDWRLHRGTDYRYFFVRGDDRAFREAIRYAECAPLVVSERGPWKVYEHAKCRK